MYWPFAIYFVMVLGVVAAMLIISFFLGEKHRERTTGQPYESGIKPAESAGIKFSVKFYQVALFFVVFDIESIFIFSWVIAFKELGWTGYLEIIIFIAVLIFIFIYLWRMGALDWGRSKR